MSTEEEVNEVFEILSSFLTNEIYNSLYIKSIALFQEKGTSVTDNYRSILLLYHGNMKNKESSRKWFNRFIVQTKLQFEEHTAYKFITHEDCINKLSMVFIPVDFISSISNKDKTTLVYDCVSRVIANVITEINTSFIAKIIDDHNNRENIEQLKNSFLLNFAVERDSIISKFVQNHTRSSIAQSLDFDTVKKIRDFAGEMKHQCDILTKKNAELMREKTNLEIKMKEIHDFYRTIKSKYTEVVSQAQSAREEVNNVKQIVSARDRTISQLKEHIQRTEAERDRVLNKLNSLPSQNHQTQFAASRPSGAQFHEEFGFGASKIGDKIITHVSDESPPQPPALVLPPTKKPAYGAGQNNMAVKQYSVSPVSSRKSEPKVSSILNRDDGSGSSDNDENASVADDVGVFNNGAHDNRGDNRGNNDSSDDYAAASDDSRDTFTVTKPNTLGQNFRNFDQMNASSDDDNQIKLDTERFGGDEIRAQFESEKRKASARRGGSAPQKTSNVRQKDESPARLMKIRIHEEKDHSGLDKEDELLSSAGSNGIRLDISDNEL
jgi:hypothetical protein